MRNFLATLFVAGATASMSADYMKCADALVNGSDLSKSGNCAGMSSHECFCANQHGINSMSRETADACSNSGMDMNNLAESLCGSSKGSTDVSDRHASNPMEPATGFGTDNNVKKRAYAPKMPAPPRTVYVTETHKECSCKSTPAVVMHLPFVSQIPVDVPASSSKMGLAAMSTPMASSSMGVMVGSSSSVAYGVQSATPTPSGASANRFNAFQGAAPAGSSVHAGVAALGVAAVMALMVAL